ncbi:MAG: PEP-CTERM sorting domain-containing protein [Gammaproteobacteria bacterium]|nr:PEP-CTERM sorting domain-containing protein [Gammaproteobacteria bacterium]
MINLKSVVVTSRKNLRDTLLLEIYSGREKLNKISKYSAILLFLLVQSVVSSAGAAIISVNLNNFFADPSVTVSADGTSARISEDPLLFSTLLVNDPGLGDPDVIIPDMGTTLNFSYRFIEAVGEDNEFGVFVIDAATGGSAGNDFEFFTQDSGSGIVSFDLTSLAGQTSGLQFSLTALPGDAGFDSVVTISDVFLKTSDVTPVPVPEPSALLLFLIGFVCLLLSGSRRNTDKPLQISKVIIRNNKQPVLCAMQ